MTPKRIFLSLFFVALAAFAVVLGYFFRQTAKRSAALRKEVNIIVYAPRSFIDPFGPGDQIKNDFEKQCDCTVEYVDMGGAVTAIQKMKMDPSRRVDVVLGVDLLDLQSVFTSVKVETTELPWTKFRPEIRPLVFPRFVPYDWSPMGFVYRQGEIKPSSSLTEFLQTAPARSVALEDPELSSAGLEWLYWVFQTQPNSEEALKSLRRVTETVAPTWSTAYGLFKNKQAKVAFSYLTSLVYHWSVDKDFSYQFMPFKEGHPMQVEYAFVPDSCWSCEVGKQFVRYLLSPATQKLLAEKNYMFPVVENIQLGEAFQKLPKVKVFGPNRLQDFERQQDELIKKWNNL